MRASHDCPARRATREKWYFFRQHHLESPTRAGRRRKMSGAGRRVCGAASNDADSLSERSNVRSAEFVTLILRVENRQAHDPPI
jgi:hypothetical protein